MDAEIATLIDEIGKTLVLRKVKSGEYDPQTGQAATSEKDYECGGLILDYKDRDRDGTLIQAMDKKAVLRASDVLKNPPDVNDKIVTNDRQYFIVSVRIVESSGIPLIYTCQIRG